MRSAALTRRPNRIRTMTHEIAAVRPTPINTAVAAAASARLPPSTHHEVRPGSVRMRRATATGATIARTPSRRITCERLRAGAHATDSPDVPTRVRRKYAEHGASGPQRSPAAGPIRRRCACYNPPGRSSRAGIPANPEVSVRAFVASRPTRGASVRPADSDPPRRRRRTTGDVYPVPDPRRVGVHDSRGALMPATVIVGLQWGDEGKGKTTDFLAEQVAMVVRYQGGDNAGHTVVSGDEVLKLRLTPSGALYPHITSVIGNGVVVNPVTLIGELDMLASRGIDVSRVRVSRSAHVIMPYHLALDAGNESRLGGAKVGTTGRGIGPTYGDRAWRLGLRMEDLLDAGVLRERIERSLPDKNLILAAMDCPTFEVEPLLEQALGWGARLRDHLDDTTWLVQAALARGEHVLLEGAQGTLLDLDHGSYPDATSSNPVAGGACPGGGVGPRQINEVIGVLKAYSTRVGAGPLPTELHDEVGAHLVESGREYGTTTGRKRRCGWLDFVPLRYAVQVNSVSSIVLNKLDILSGLPEVKVCVGYRVDGRLVEEWPLSAALLERAAPVYETFEGWTQDLRACRSIDELPAPARRYVAAIEQRAGVP